MTNKEKIIQDYLKRTGVDPNHYTGSARYFRDKAIRDSDVSKRTRKYQLEWEENETKAKKRDADKLLKTIQKFREGNDYDPETERYSNLLDQYRNKYGTNINSPVSKSDLNNFDKYMQYLKKEQEPKEQAKQEQPKKDDGNFFKDLFNTAKRGVQAINPFDDVSMKEALLGEINAKRSNDTEEVNRFATRTLDSATLGGLKALEKGVTGETSDRYDMRKFGEGGTADFISSGLGYLIPGTGAAKLVRGTKLGANTTKGMSTLQKALQYGKEGAVTGLGLGLAETPAREYTNPEESSLARIGLETIGGAVADPVLHVVGSKLASFFGKNRVSKQEIAQALRDPQVPEEIKLEIRKTIPQKVYEPTINEQQPFNVLNGPIRPQTSTENVFANLRPQSAVKPNVNVDKAYYDEFGKALDEQVALLKSQMGKGVTQGHLIQDEAGNVIDRVGRISNNPQWYQELYAQLGKQPNNEDLYNLAYKQLTEGYVDDGVQIPPWQPKQAQELTEEISQLEGMNEPSLQRTLEVLKQGREEVSKPRTSINIEPKTVEQPNLNELIQKLKNVKPKEQPKEIYENISQAPKGQSLAKVKEIDHNEPRQEEKFILSQDKQPFNLKRRLNRAYQNTFDTQHLIAGISNDTKVKASNARQTQGIVDFIAEKGLVNKEGEKIGESLTELTQNIPLDKESDFWRYMGHQHNIARSQEGKNVFSQFDSELSNKEAQQLLAQNPEFEETGKKVTEWINKFMDTWAKDLVGEDTLKMWREMYPNYFPVYREIDPLKQASFNGAKRGFVNQHNLVKKAKGAKADLSSNIKDPIGNIVQLVNKTVKAQKNNEVGLAILDEVKKGSLDDLFEVVGTKPKSNMSNVLKDEGIDGVMENLTEQFDDVFKQAEKGNNIVKIMDNGNEVLLKVKDLDYLKALQSLSDGTGKSAAEQFERAARRVARPIKELITGKNPLFAVFNVMRDTPTAFIQGQEKNPIKFANRYMRALKEITHNSKGFQEFAAQGGMQSGFFKNDILKTTKQLKNYKDSPLRKLVGTVEAFNNLIEATPRYMEYLATLEKGGTKAQGIYNAAEVTTNFARNGKWGKFFDSFILYLNPALQGLDKFIRQVKDKPLQTALKAGGVITVPQVVTEYVNNDNPNYQSLDQRLKDDFFLIPNQFGPKDEQGYAEKFFRIPKARQYSVLFSVLTNRIGEIANGKSVKDASKGVIGSFDRNFSVPTRPIWSPFSDVARNKDWKNAPINSLGMTLDNRSNYLKYDERTSEVGKVLAELLNKQPIDGIKYSPKDIDYLIDSYTGIIGDILLPVATKTESILGIPQKKFIADSVYSNQSVNDFYDNMQKLRNRASDKNILENIPSEAKTKEEAQRNNLDKLSKLISSLNSTIKQTDDEEKQRKLRKQIIDLAQKGNTMYNKYTR